MLSDNVKPGDKLARLGGYYGTVYTLVQVKHVTRSGQIVLTNGERYNSAGREIGGAQYSKDTLYILTPELEKKIKRANNLDYINGVQWKKLDDETLATVVQVLKTREG